MPYLQVKGTAADGVMGTPSGSSRSVRAAKHAWQCSRRVTSDPSDACHSACCYPQQESIVKRARPFESKTSNMKKPEEQEQANNLFFWCFMLHVVSNACVSLQRVAGCSFDCASSLPNGHGSDGQ